MAKREELNSLQKANLTLRRRCTALAIAQRCLEEVVAHKRTHGGDTAAEEAQLDALLAAAACSSGGGGGGSLPAPAPQPLLLPLPHLAPGASITGLDSATLEEVAAVCSCDHVAIAAHFARLLSEGHRLIQELHPTPPPAAARGRRPLLGGRGAAAEGVRAAAVVALREVGAAVRRTYMLLEAWAPHSFLLLFNRDHQTGRDILGVQPPPQHVYDVAITRARFCREQALVVLENNKLLQERVAKLGVQRARIAAALSALNSEGASPERGGSATGPSPEAFTSGGGGGGGGGSDAPSLGGGGGGSDAPSLGGGGGGGSDAPSLGGGGGAAAAAAGDGAAPAAAAGAGGAGAAAEAQGQPDGGGGQPDYSGWIQEELVHELAINSACEKGVILLHAMVNTAVLSDEQVPYIVCAPFPHPVNVKSVMESFRHLLVADGGAALPWAGPPWDSARP